MFTHEGQAMGNLTRITKYLGVLLVLAIVLPANMAMATHDDLYKTVDGLAVYLGVVPAEIVKGHLPGHAEQTMHGGVPSVGREYHVVAAVFDAASKARISDAAVTAQVSGLALAGSKKRLEPMDIANTITYGGFFALPGRDLYTIRLEILRPGSEKPVVVEFQYDKRE
jgi:hypothetical protein